MVFRDLNMERVCDVVDHYSSSEAEEYHADSYAQIAYLQPDLSPYLNLFS